MKTTSNDSYSVLSQTEKNTTHWIGQLKQEASGYLVGQTFACPAEGMIDNIQVYSAAVTRPGEVQLTLHEFDAASRSWGLAIGHAKLDVDRKDIASWLRFKLVPVELRKNSTYGFRLESTDAFVGIGEAVTNSKFPFAFGQEWDKHSNSDLGNFFKYFSLAFKIEMRA